MENETLSTFLKKILNDVETDQLSPSKLKHIYEFYMAYQSYDENVVNPSSSEMLKCLTLGWFIYNSNSLLENN